MIAVVLFLLPWVVLLVVLRQDLDSGAMVAAVSVVAGASIGLSTLWLTWAAFREARRSDGGAAGLNLGQLADQLAVAVGAQWEAEAALRRLNDPFPLPVSWTAADLSLTDRLLGVTGDAGDQRRWMASASAREGLGCWTR